MNILHISAVKNWGGGENHVENLCRELKFSHPEVKNTILCAKHGAFYARIKDSEFEVIPARLPLKVSLGFVLKIINLCKTKQINLIHIQDPTALMLSIIADKIKNLPPMIFSKKTSFPIKNRKQTLYKYNYPNIKKILCVSQETKRIAAKAIHDNKKLVTIYHGTNLNTKSVNTPFNLRVKLSLDSSRAIIGNIANHIRAKNLGLLLEVAHILIHKQNRNLHFVQFGSFTKKTPILQEKVKELGLEKHFSFMGFIKNASNFIPQFDISVMSSQSEGIPGFIYESFYHKRVVASTNVGGIPEIIENGVNGMLSEPHNAEALAKNIAYLLDTPKIISKFVENSEKKLHSHFTTKIMAEKTFLEYKKVLAQN